MELKLDEKTLYVGKCTSVGYLIAFLKWKLKLSKLYLMHKFKPLNQRANLQDYSIGNDDEICLHIPGLEGGAPDTWSCTYCSSCFDSEYLLNQHLLEIHPEKAPNL